MMSASYVDLFDIKEVFEQNSKQRILMGTPKNAPGEVVVINRFYHDALFDENLSPLLKRSLKNVIHIETTASELVVVTAYPVGTALTLLAESPRLLPQDRLRLAELYLDIVTSYESLPPSLQYLLIDLNQFVVQETGLEPKELLLLDRNFNPVLTGDVVAKKLSAALNLILKPDSTPYEEWESDGIKNMIAGLGVGAIVTLAAARGTFAGLVASSERMAGVYDTSSKSDPFRGAASFEDAPLRTKAGTDGKTASGAGLAAGAGLAFAGTGTSAASAASASGQKNASIGANAADRHEFEKGRMIELDNLFVENENPKHQEALKRNTTKKRQFKWLAWILLIAVAALVLFGIFNMLTGLFARKAPEARFVSEKDNITYHFINKSTVSGNDNKLTQIQWRIDKDGTELLTSDEFDLTVTFKNSGKYKITLMVKDRYRWSNAYSQIVEYEVLQGSESTGEIGVSTGTVSSGSADDPLAGITTSATSDNVTIDKTESRTGSNSLKLDMTGSDQAQMTLDGLSVSKATALSFWMRSNTTDRVILTVFGYDANGLRFTKKMTINPAISSTWEMITLQSNYNDISSMKLQFSSADTILWLDDFELAAFK